MYHIHIHIHVLYMTLVIEKNSAQNFDCKITHFVLEERESKIYNFMLQIDRFGEARDELQDKHSPMG